MAELPSPEKPVAPSPATVVIMPMEASTQRTRLLSVSAINRLPSLSRTMPQGKLRLAPVANPPSPEKPFIPFPTTVVMMPEDASTRQIRELSLSAMNRLP